MTTPYGITGYGAYVPRLRLARSAIAEAHRWMNPSLNGAAKGERAFCSFDEDVVTMAVEAGRDCAPVATRGAVRRLHLASTTFPYADLSNAVIAAAALGLDERIETVNAAGSQRASTTGLIQALSARDGDALLIASERPIAKPASPAEMQLGAGAAALRLGSENVVATLLGSASRSVYFVDRFRASDQASDYAWEERWIRDEGYAKLIPPTVKEALAAAGVGMADIHHFLMPSPIRGAAAAVGKQLGFTGEVASGLEAGVGYCGAAHAYLMLVEALERAKPGERLLVVGFGQGVDALVLETTAALAAFKPARGLSGAVADKMVTAEYLRMLSFQDQIALDWGMRGERGGKAALTEQYRSSHQLTGFTAGRCSKCGTVQFPQLAYCVNAACHAPASAFEPVSLADQPAKIFTVTVDWLSYHPAPPLCVGFVQFDIGARLMMELVDADPAALEVGVPVRMVLRIKERDRERGFNRYFWKATPLAA